MQKHKVLVLDIDGTLTNSQKEISAANKEAIMKAQQAGVKIVLASGRPTFGIEPIANELEIDRYGGFILAYNGGKIINYQTGEVVYELDFPNELVKTVYETAKENNLAIISYDEKHIITENGEDGYVQKEAFLNRAPVKQVNDFLQAIPAKIPKCLIVGDVEKIEPLEKKMYKAHNEKINVYRSEPYFLELVPLNIDKAYSLEKLARHLGISSENMVACGDGFNDLSMIKYAGIGVAMSNAQDTVKEAADYITFSNDEDGVAHVIEKFFGQNFLMS